MKFTFTYVLFILVLASCGQTPENKPKEPKIASKQDIPNPDKKVPVADPDTTPLKIITTGMFHSDEVWDTISRLKWIGLFKGKNGYYLKQAKVRAVRINDPVLDEESEKTGWELSVPGKDNNILLISPPTRFSDRIIQEAAISKSYIYPGETVSFR